MTENEMQKRQVRETGIGFRSRSDLHRLNGSDTSALEDQFQTFTVETEFQLACVPRRNGVRQALLQRKFDMIQESRQIRHADVIGIRLTG